MSEENVEVVQRVVAAINERDVDRYLSCLLTTSRFELHGPESGACTKALLTSGATSRAWATRALKAEALEAAGLPVDP